MLKYIYNTENISSTIHQYGNIIPTNFQNFLYVSKYHIPLSISPINVLLRSAGHPIMITVDNVIIIGGIRNTNKIPNT